MAHTIITDQDKLSKWLAAGAPGNFANWTPEVSLSGAIQTPVAVPGATPVPVTTPSTTVPNAIPQTPVANVPAGIPTDPDYYGKTQEKLYGAGAGILEGNLPDYYKDIGTMGGQSFEDMLNLTKADVSRSINEDIIRRGVSRGGLGASLTARKMGDISIAAREAERLRALTAKQDLLKTGLSTLSDVRGGALTKEGIDLGAEQFEKNLALDKEKLEYLKFQADREQANQKNQAISNILGSIIGTGANLYMNSQLTKALTGASTAQTASAAQAAAAGTPAAKAAAAKVATEIGMGPASSAAAALAASQAGIGAGATGLATGVGGGATGFETAAAGAGLGTALMAVIPIAGIAAVAYAMFGNKKGTVNVSPEQVVEKSGDLAQTMPETIGAMVKMRQTGVWDEEKNFYSHINNITDLRKAVEERGKEFKPEEWDSYVGQVMMKGESWQNENAQLLAEVDKRYGPAPAKEPEKPKDKYEEAAMKAYGEVRQLSSYEKDLIDENNGVLPEWYVNG